MVPTSYIVLIFISCIVVTLIYHFSTSKKSEIVPTISEATKKEGISNIIDVLIALECVEIELKKNSNSYVVSFSITSGKHDKFLEIKGFLEEMIAQESKNNTQFLSNFSFSISNNANKILGVCNFWFKDENLFENTLMSYKKNVLL